MDKNTQLVNLGKTLFEWFSQLERDRRDKEVEWAESLRQYRGEYDPEELQRINNNNGSKVYPKITRYKLLTALAKINEILFPDIDKNWSIEPSPYPTVPKNVLVDIVKNITKVDEQGMPMKPTNEEINHAIYRYVSDQCKRMETTIEDDLNEMGYTNLVMQVVFSGLLFGTGVLKGVLAKSITNYQWTAKDNDYQLVSEVTYRPYAEFVPIWNWYPDSSVSDIKDCEGIFERHILSKHDVRNLMKRPDFDQKQIEEFLRQFPKGNSSYKSWEIDVFTNERVASRQNKYDILEFWGYLDGLTLRECGVNVPESMDNSEVEANIWLAGDRVIKATLNPFDNPRRPYHVFYYEKDETSIFGTGLPKICRDSQIAISAATRMLLDNAAIVSGPQLEVNVELLLQNEQDITSIHPRKIWLREGKGAEAQYPALRPIEFNSHMSELLQIIQIFKQFIDEETTIYNFFGEPTRVSGATARGTSIRMSLVNMTLKDIIRKFDLMNTSFIKSMYEWNMQFNPNPDIKGDFEIIAKGSASLVAKEVRTEALNFFTQTLLPDEIPYLKRYAFLKERMKALDLPYKDLLRSEEEAEMIIMSQQDPELIALQKALLKADIDYTNSKSLHMLAKSKKQQHTMEQDDEIGEDIALAEMRAKQAKALKDLLEATLKKEALTINRG